MTSVVVIGEGMLELSRAGKEGLYAMRSAGDALNVAIYLARLGCAVRFLTALGTDSYSRSMRLEWADEGIDTSLVLTHPERRPGLYIIETDAHGERQFHYWRDQSAARSLFACEGIEEALDNAARAALVYVSGITLSLYGRAGRARLIALCARARERGARVAFDTNYRPRGWSSPQAAREAIAEFAHSVDIAMPTLEDEHMLYGDVSAESVRARWLSLGAAEVVVKMGARGALVDDVGGPREIMGAVVIKPVDTTGAGDSFNAAYLYRRLSHATPVEAARSANQLGAAVVGYHGAVITKAAMPGLAT